jgi:hypothetical protein
MGEPLYQMQAPTGYPMTADHWMNSAGLVDRLNFSMQLAASKIGGMKFDAPQLLASGMLSSPPTVPLRVAQNQDETSANTAEDHALDLMEMSLVAGDVSAKTNAVIREQLAQTQPQQDTDKVLDTMAALILGSPEFQMR